jgi:hypothetical protein
MTALLTPASFSFTRSSVPVANLTAAAPLILAMITESPKSAFVSLTISALSSGFSASAAQTPAVRIVAARATASQIALRFMMTPE